jgi:transcription termination factor Rho
MNLTEIKVKPINELVDIATELGLEDVGRLKKQEIIFRIFKHKASEGIDIYGGGVLEILNDGFGFFVLLKVHIVQVKMIYMFLQVR